MFPSHDHEEGGIYRGNYVGGAFTWRFDYVVRNKPAPYRGACVQVGNNVYFLSLDGFYMYNGSSAVPISSGKMSQTFLDDLDAENADLMTSSVDLQQNLIFFAYPGAGHAPDECNRIMCYNYVTNLWTGPIEQRTQQLLFSQTPGVLSDAEFDPESDGNVDTGIYANTRCDDAIFQGGADHLSSAFIPGNFHAIPVGPIKRS